MPVYFQSQPFTDLKNQHILLIGIDSTAPSGSYNNTVSGMKGLNQYVCPLNHIISKDGISYNYMLDYNM